MKGLTGKWVQYTSDNSPLPAHAIVYPFDTGRQGQVWLNIWISQGIGVPAQRYGLVLTDGENWSEYKYSQSALSLGSIEYMAVDSQDCVWLSVADIGIFYFDGQIRRSYTFGDAGFPSNQIWIIKDIYVDQSDCLWVATWNDGLYSFSNEQWRKIKGPGLSDEIEAMGFDQQGQLWVACKEAREIRFLMKVEDEWQFVCTLPHQFRSGDWISCLTIDANQKIWVGKKESGLIVWEGKRWKKFTEQDNVRLAGGINSLTIDEFHNLWVGTSSGLDIFDGNKWHEWRVLRLQEPQKPLSQDELPEDVSPMTGADYIYLGNPVKRDGLNRKWIPTLNGVVVFTSEQINNNVNSA